MSGQVVGTMLVSAKACASWAKGWRLGQSRVLLYSDPKRIMEEEMETTLYTLGILITGMALQPYGYGGFESDFEVLDRVPNKSLMEKSISANPGADTQTASETPGAASREELGVPLWIHILGVRIYLGL